MRRKLTMELPGHIVNCVALVQRDAWEVVSRLRKVTVRENVGGPARSWADAVACSLIASVVSLPPKKPCSVEVAFPNYQT